MSIELIIAIGGFVIAIGTFLVGRFTAASSFGRKQGEMETRVTRLEEDVRNIQSNCRECPERYVSKSSFNEVVHRVDDGIRDLQSRLDTIYSFLVSGRPGQ
jgi:hypothetical protein